MQEETGYLKKQIFSFVLTAGPASVRTGFLMLLALRTA
jgi:hypothetical protein